MRKAARSHSCCRYKRALGTELNTIKLRPQWLFFSVRSPVPQRSAQIRSQRLLSFFREAPAWTVLPSLPVKHKYTRLSSPHRSISWKDSRAGTLPHLQRVPETGSWKALPVSIISSGFQEAFRWISTGIKKRIP